MGAWERNERVASIIRKFLVWLQERFNKDLEEIKKSQYIVNNAINEIKNTLEGTNSRITEAEDSLVSRR